jgi:hypothetical protein
MVASDESIAYAYELVPRPQQAHRLAATDFLALAVLTSLVVSIVLSIVLLLRIFIIGNSIFPVPATDEVSMTAPNVEGATGASQSSRPLL